MQFGIDPAQEPLTDVYGVQNRVIQFIATNRDRIEKVVALAQISIRHIAAGGRDFIEAIELTVWRELEDRIRPSLILERTTAWFSTGLVIEIAGVDLSFNLSDAITDPAEFAQRFRDHNGFMVVRVTALVLEPLAHEIEVAELILQPDNTNDDNGEDDTFGTADQCSPDPQAAYPLDALLETIQELTGD